MKVATFKGGMFGYGENEKLQCVLCGELDLDKLIVQRLGISVGMCGDDYTFCEKCWNGKNFGKRLLQYLGYEGGMRLQLDILDIKEIEDCK
jgi:hypothetical protein